MEKYVGEILYHNSDNIEKSLQEYIDKVSQKFEFPELDIGNNRKDVWAVLYKLLSSTKQSGLQISCLTLCRILSREKRDLNEIINNDWLNIINYHACFTKGKALDDVNKVVAIEALKALYNIIFNSSVAIALTSQNGTLDCIIERIKLKSTFDIKVKMFDMKILFLITALCPEIQFKVKNDMNGLKYLLQDLQCIILKTNFNHNSDKKKYPEELLDVEVDFCCEILKVLFNLTLTWNTNETIEEEEEKYCIELVIILRQLLLKPVIHDKKKYELHNNVANLITNIPDKYLISLIPNDQIESVNNEKDFEALNILLDLLQKKFDLEFTVQQQHDALSPILTVFYKLANSNKLFRKYLRRKILPPLRDVHTRPEEGKTLRNYLCKLLTSPVTQVRDLSAELLFKLCRENVSRMIKYTGYGNAAGMFANRGLLGGQNTTKTSDSDTSDSETEEYNEYKHGINPVVGCYEAPKSNPLEGMSDEQKEYEVMKLVKLMDDMTKKGLVKPCKIGEDGKPEPIEHVLQLQEGLPAQQIRQNNDESD